MSMKKQVFSYPKHQRKACASRPMFGESRRRGDREGTLNSVSAAVHMSNSSRGKKKKKKRGWEEEGKAVLFYKMSRENEMTTQNVSCPSNSPKPKDFTIKRYETEKGSTSYHSSYRLEKQNGFHFCFNELLGQLILFSLGYPIYIHWQSVQCFTPILMFLVLLFPLFFMTFFVFCCMYQAFTRQSLCAAAA